MHLFDGRHGRVAACVLLLGGVAVAEEPAHDAELHSADEPVTSEVHQGHGGLHGHGLHGHDGAHVFGPIGVMADHTHGAGEWMLSYRYIAMSMDGNRGRGGRKSRSDVLADFPVAPTDMLMQMHMLGIMHAPTDDLTLMLMLPYLLREMDHVTRTGVEFTTKSDGPGDISLSGLWVLHRWGHQQVHLNFGVSLPTGSIEETDDTPAGTDTKLPYPMQLGSGTFDLLPGLTYLGESGDFSWGAQAIGRLRLGRNSSGYSLGDRARLSIWGTVSWLDWLSTSLRLDGHIYDNIDGADADFNPAMVPTADPSRRGGERVDVLVGLNLYGDDSWSAGQRLGIELGVPIYQALDGPQLETDWTLTVGWQYAW